MKLGTTEVSAAQVSFKQINPPQIGSTEISSSQISSFHRGLPQNGITQVSTSQVGILQTHLVQISSTQISSTQIGSNQIRKTELGTAQIYPYEATATEAFVTVSDFDSGKISFPSSVPFKQFVNSYSLSFHNSTLALDNVYKGSPLNLWSALFNPTFNINF